MSIFSELRLRLDQANFNDTEFQRAANAAIDDHLNTKDATQALTYLATLWPEHGPVNAYTVQGLFGDYCIYQTIDEQLHIRQLI